MTGLNPLARGHKLLSIAPFPGGRPRLGTAAVSDIDTVRRVLRESRSIAVAGLSAGGFRPSHFAARCLREHGYRIVPVYPKYPAILGEKRYPSLAALPERVDPIDVFRKPAVAAEAVAIGARRCGCRPARSACRILETLDDILWDIDRAPAAA